MGKAGTSASRFVKRNTKPAPALRSETADKILDLAERLIQTRGCSAFSYQDIADALKIRKGEHPLSLRIENGSGDRRH